MHGSNLLLAALPIQSNFLRTRLKRRLNAFWLKLSDPPANFQYPLILNKHPGCPTLGFSYYPDFLTNVFGLSNILPARLLRDIQYSPDPDLILPQFKVEPTPGP